ncbi:MAG: autoinducer 2 ABC transporter substrate-binding protein [Candidatus Sumerlaeaceae bacterium]
MATRLVCRFSKVAMLVLASCLLPVLAFSAETAGAPGKKLTIAVMPKLVGIDYFNAVQKGAEEAAKEIGAELIWDGPTENDVTKQAEMIDTWIARKVDVIAVAPNDPHALAPTLKKAQKRGIKVLTYDADSDADSRSYFVNQATAEAIGFGLVDVIAEQISGKGEVAIVTGSMTADNQNTWMKHMDERMKKYPEMKKVIVKPSEENQQLAVSVTKDLLKAYPDLKGIFAITSVALPGAALALKEAGASGKVALTGLSTPKSMVQHVDNGSVKTFLLWNPVDLGYLTVQTAKAVATGQKLGDKISAGRLGDKQVKGTEVLLGDPMRFSKENVHQFQF